MKDIIDPSICDNRFLGDVRVVRLHSLTFVWACAYAYARNAFEFVFGPWDEAMVATALALVFLGVAIYVMAVETGAADLMPRDFGILLPRVLR